MDRTRIKHIVVAEDEPLLRTAVMDRMEMITSDKEILISGTQESFIIIRALADPETIVILDGSVAMLAEVDLKDLDPHRVVVFSGSADFLMKAVEAGLPIVQKGAASKELTEIVLSMLEME